MQMPVSSVQDRRGDILQACILVGHLAAITSLIGYGSSTTYVCAIILRFLPSLLIGSPVAIKAMIGDACDQNGQAKAMAVFTLGQGIGTVLGKAPPKCTCNSRFPSCRNFQQQVSGNSSLCSIMQNLPNLRGRCAPQSI